MTFFSKLVNKKVPIEITNKHNIVDDIIMYDVEMLDKNKTVHLFFANIYNVRLLYSIGH